VNHPLAVQRERIVFGPAVRLIVPAPEHPIGLDGIRRQRRSGTHGGSVPTWRSWAKHISSALLAEELKGVFIFQGLKSMAPTVRPAGRVRDGQRHGGRGTPRPEGARSLPGALSPWTGKATPFHLGLEGRRDAWRRVPSAGQGGISHTSRHLGGRRRGLAEPLPVITLRLPAHDHSRRYAHDRSADYQAC
jgi:hypothetical protein